MMEGTALVTGAARRVGRAISVVRYAVTQGVPAARLAAAGFADNQPLDPAESEEAYRRNRRIELKLTER